MIYHIRINDRAFCRCGNIDYLDLMDRLHGIPAVCASSDLDRQLATCHILSEKHEGVSLHFGDCEAQYEIFDHLDDYRE